MKSILTVLFALAGLNAVSADEPATPGPSGSSHESEAPVIRNVQRALRLPASALRRREAAGASESSETTATASGTATVDLSGRWLLTLPAGYQYRVTIDALGENRYRLRSAVSFSGVYQLNGDVLQIIEPSDERLNVFDWQLHNINSMTLVSETGASGARYAGATMGRQFDPQGDELPHRITAIGRPAVPRPARAAVARSTASRRVTLTGTAFNDETQGPYLETDETIVFLAGLEAWPAEVLNETVRVTGSISRFVIQDEGESLVAQRLTVASWSRVSGVEEASDDASARDLPR